MTGNEGGGNHKVDMFRWRERLKTKHSLGTCFESVFISSLAAKF